MKYKLLISFLLLFCVSFSQNTCPATFICNTHNTTPNGSGSGGQYGELSSSTDGCLSGEHNSTWLTITILTSGTLTFTIDPNNNSNDFDFAIWGPNSTCPPTNSPIRCSYAAGTGNTGLNTTAGDVAEGIFGNGWVSQLNVTAGESYLILVDNFTTNNGFEIRFGGTSILNCTILPIELTYFKCSTMQDNILIEWETESESNNQEFQLWRSIDGVNWVKIYTRSGAGNSTIPKQYWYNDYLLPTGVYYYKLIQKDYNGTETSSDITSCNFILNSNLTITYYNLIGQEVKLEEVSSGFYIKESRNKDKVKREVIYK